MRQSYASCITVHEVNQPTLSISVLVYMKYFIINDQLKEKTRLADKVKMMIISCQGPPIHPNGTNKRQWGQTSSPTTSKEML